MLLFIFSLKTYLLKDIVLFSHEIVSSQDK